MCRSCRTAPTSASACGTSRLYILLAFLLATWLSAAFGPPPPNERTLAWSALTMWLLVAWAYWVDRHRDVSGARKPF
jgi:hypothetical protein